MTEFSYQLYSSRNFGPIGETLKMVAGFGYAQVEGYGGLYADPLQVESLVRDMRGCGLEMPTGHFGLAMVKDFPGKVLEICRSLGVTGVIVPAVPQGERVKDAAGWAALGRELATVGKPYWDAGLTFGWHNHSFEFAAIDGPDLPLDLILAGDARLALEIDVAWVVKGGQDPLKWIAKYGDRIVAAHLKDIAPAGQSLDEDGWADLGQGTMDWPAIMAALRKTGARTFVMEHDNPKDDRRFASRSIEAARKL